MSEKTAHTLAYSLPTDHDPTNVDPRLFAVVQGDRALINSASEPSPEAMKLELLPSLQHTETDLSSWDTSSSPPTLRASVDNFIQSPARTGKMNTDSLSPPTSGLLDALVHETKIRSSGQIRSSDKCSMASASSTLTPGDMSSSSPDMCMTEWEKYDGPISPFGDSATSAFKECTPKSGIGSSFDKQPPDTFSVCKVKPEPLCEAQSRAKEQQIPPHCDPMQPDALLASVWIGLGTTSYEDQAPIPDAIVLLLGDGLCKEYKQSGGVADLAWGHSSCAWKWNNIPACLLHV